MPELERVSDDDVLFAKDLTYREEVRARARTVITEMQHGLQVDSDDKTHRTAADILQERTSFEEYKTKPDVILHLAAIMNEFDHDVVEDAVRMRRFVTNKLMLEANKEDIKPSERIKALELLGKISDVGLFAERSVITVEHRTTEDLEKEFAETIQLLLNPDTNTYEEKPKKTARPESEPIDVDFKSIEIGVK